MNEPRPLQPARQILEEALGFSLEDWQYNFLLEDGTVLSDELSVEGDDYKAAVARIRKLWPPDKYGRRPRAESKAPKMLRASSLKNQREDALSVLYANKASEELEVKDFREIALSNKLLEWDQVPGWIEKHAKVERREAGWITFPFPIGTKVSQDKRGFSFKPPLKINRLDVSEGQVGFSVKTLAYAGPDDRWTLRVPVFPGRLMEKLATISKSLVKRYYWREAQATVFILTGIPPCVETIQAQFENSSSGVNRLVLTIDPSLSPEEVKRAYKSLRCEAFPDASKRASGKRQYALVAFVTENPELSTWEERRKAWNKKFPKEWYYSERDNFQRDHDKTKKRLLGEMSPRFQKIEIEIPEGED